MNERRKKNAPPELDLPGGAVKKINHTIILAINKEDGKMENVKVYKIGNAIVRIHGEPNMENLKRQTALFMGEVLREQRRNEVRKDEV